MLKPWANFGLNVLFIFAFVIGVLGFLSNIEKYGPTYDKFRLGHGILVSFIKSVFKLYGKFLAAIAVTAVIAVVVYVFGYIRETPPPPNPTPTIVPTSEPTITIIDPTSFSLDDFQVLRMEPDTAFVFHQWERNYPIKIDNTEYNHSIGARLPFEVEENLKDNHSTERKLYSAEIEYSLGYKYDTFQFSHGIDDNAFKDFGLSPPNCHYWIVVESCFCREDSEEKSIEIYRTPEVNYMQTIKTSDLIDVSNVETLRLTVYWLFDVLPIKPLTLNVAIVNPTLYVSTK